MQTYQLQMSVSHSSGDNKALLFLNLLYVLPPLYLFLVFTSSPLQGGVLMV